MVRWIDGLVVFLIWLLAAPLAAQHWDNAPLVEAGQLTMLDDPDAPLQPCVGDIRIDAQGRLWLSVCSTYAVEYQMLLLQYDGYRLAQKEINGFDLAGRSIINLASTPDQEGIWGYLNGRGESLLIHAVGTDPNIRVYPTGFDNIRNLVVDDAGNFWLGVIEGWGLHICQWSPDSCVTATTANWESTVRGWSNTHQLPDAFYLQYDKEHLWMAFSNGPIYRYHPGTQRTDTLQVIDKGWRSSRHPRPLQWVVTHGNTTLVLLSDRLPGLFVYQPEQDHLLPHPAVPDGWNCVGMSQDKTGRIALLFEQEQGPLRLLVLEPSGQVLDYSALVTPFDRIFAIQSDDLSRRLYVATRYGAYFVAVRETAGIQCLDSGSMRWVVELPDGAIWGSRQDRNCWIYREGKLTENPKVASTILGQVIANRWLGQIIPAPDGRSWMVWREQLLELDPNKRDLEVHPLGVPLQRGVFLDAQTLIFVEGATRQLYRYRLDTRQLEALTFPGQAPPEFPSGAQVLYCDASGLLWVAAVPGLIRIDLAARQWRRIGESGLFPEQRFLTIHERPNGHLWLGTVNHGILVYDPRKDELIRTISTADGLSNNTVVSMLTDADGDIWAATYHGLNLLSPSGEIRTILHEVDGISHSEFNRFSAYRDPTGKLWFGSLDGMNLIEPLLVKNRLLGDTPTQLFLRHIQYFDPKENKNRLLDNPDDEQLTPIRLAATRRNLQLSVGMSNYGFSDRNRFAYQLQGINDDWIYLGTNHELNLSNLPPGRYLLRIKGLDHRGIWTEPLVIPIRAANFFYRQPWFYVLLTSVLSLVAFYWIRRLRTEKVRLESEVVRRTRQIQEDKATIETQARELKQLDELKSRFFTDISHELRTPLTLVTGPLEHMLKEPNETPFGRMKDRLRLALNSSRGLLRLVEELLDLSRLEADRIRLQKTATSLQKYSLQLFERFESIALRQTIEFHFSHNLHTSDLYYIDRDQLEKILNNLLSNAVKFTPAGGRIDFSVTRQEAALHFSVRDTGRGIPPEDQPHIFERYFQTKRTDLSFGKGVGIGLALSHELAHLMGGQLTMESTWGKGSTFLLQLPAEYAGQGGEELPTDLHPSTELELGTPATAQQTPPSSDRPTVLIVEDNTEMRKFIRQLLSDRYHCLETEDGLQAWELLQQSDTRARNIQLICSDIRMPQMDGYTLAKKIKADSYWQQIPMVLLTARSTEATKIGALRMGVDDYITKPFSVDELQARIDNLVHHFQRKQQFVATRASKTEELSADQSWLAEVEQLCLDAIAKQIKLTTPYLADQLALSERQVLRRLKALTGLTTQLYVQEVKLQQARRYLEAGAFQTVAEAAYASGFSAPAYFSRVFVERFGRPPGDYALHGSSALDQ